MQRFCSWLLSLLLAAALATGTPVEAAAPAWPNRPVRLLVPAPAGSSLDVVARTLGERLAARWQQPVVVDNKPGAGGLLGMDAVVKSAPDGYTLGIGFNGPIAFAPFMYRKMPYDPGRELLPLVLTTSQPNVLAIPSSVPASNVAEFVAWAKRQGSRVSYGSVGNGSSSHLTMELFKRMAGFTAVHVPYAGSPPAGNAIGTGEVQALFSLEPALLPLVQGGRVKIIGVTSLQRVEGMKQTPTLAESGYPGFESLAWNGLFAPAGTPAAVVERVNADVNAVLKEPALRDALARQGLIVVGGSPESFKRFIESESLKWGALIHKVGITID